jgi:hypothetical protein
MTSVALVSCGEHKRSTAAAARDLYTSPRFKLSLSWAETCTDRWFVLSAKHGLVHPDRHLSPYDLSLDSLTASQIVKWYDRVASSLLDTLEGDDVVILLTDPIYGAGLKERISSDERIVLDPLKGMPLSRRLQWLATQTLLGKPSLHLERFYGELQLLADTSFAMASSWRGQNRPQRGVYFAFESDEYRSNDRDRRVTRVGTHAVRVGSQTSLWDRLRAHRGVLSGGGNHRSSVFRSHIGTALINRDMLVNRYPDWGKGRSATAEVRKCERSLEMLVSKEIANMYVVTLSVNDAPSAHSDRAYIEKNAIGLLSTVGRVSDPPNARWLGLHATSESIRCSGMWNVQNVGDSYDDRFLSVMHEYVLVTTGRKSSPTKSLAPMDW